MQVSQSIRIMRPLRMRSLAEISLGHFEQAKSDHSEAMRLSPRDPFIVFLACVLGDAELGLGHFDAAIDEYHKAIDARLSLLRPLRDLAAAYALRARRMRRNPPWRKPVASIPNSPSNGMQRSPPNIPAVFEGVRKAGLPEE